MNEIRRWRCRSPVPAPHRHEAGCRFRTVREGAGGDIQFIVLVTEEPVRNAASFVAFVETENRVLIRFITQAGENCLSRR